MIKAKFLKFFLKIYIIQKNETFLSFHLHFKRIKEKNFFTLEENSFSNLKKALELGKCVKT